MKNKNLSGTVFDIKKFAVHNGPGIRGISINYD